MGAHKNMRLKEVTKAVEAFMSFRERNNKFVKN